MRSRPRRDGGGRRRADVNAQRRPTAQRRTARHRMSLFPMRHRCKRACAETCASDGASRTRRSVQSGALRRRHGRVSRRLYASKTIWIERPTAKAGSCTCGACNITANCNSGSVDSAGRQPGRMDNQFRQRHVPTQQRRLHWFRQQLRHELRDVHDADREESVSCTGKRCSEHACGQHAEHGSVRRRRHIGSAHRKPGRVSGPFCGTSARCVPALRQHGQGTNACPAGFPVPHTSLGNGQRKSRLSCADCQCTNPTATCGGTMTYYSNGNCTGSARFPSLPGRARR